MQQNIHGGDIYSRQIRLDFSVNGNPLGTPDAAVQAIHEAVQHVGEYPDITAAALTEAVSRMLSGECGREIPKEYLLFGNGASELFLAVVHALKPRNIVIPVPSFYGYEYVAEAAGSHIKYVYLPEETGFRPGRELLQELTADTDMLFVANPNNPTGQLMGREYLQELLEHCGQQGITVVVDECFIEFCESGREQSFCLGRSDSMKICCWHGPLRKALLCQGCVWAIWYAATQSFGRKYAGSYRNGTCRCLPRERASPARSSQSNICKTQWNM